MNPDFDPERFVDAVAPAVGLHLDPLHRPGVIENIARVAHFARLVTEFPLAEEVEPGPVFTP
jgi:hypothetical protein